MTPIDKEWKTDKEHMTGIEYWTRKAYEEGLSIEEMEDIFTSAIIKQSSDTDDIVTTLYNKYVAKINPEWHKQDKHLDGIRYWTEQLNTGKLTPQNIESAFVKAFNEALPEIFPDDNPPTPGGDDNPKPPPVYEISREQAETVIDGNLDKWAGGYGLDWRKNSETIAYRNNYIDKLVNGEVTVTESLNSLIVLLQNLWPTIHDGDPYPGHYNPGPTTPIETPTTPIETPTTPTEPGYDPIPDYSSFNKIPYKDESYAGNPTDSYAFAEQVFGYYVGKYESGWKSTHADGIDHFGAAIFYGQLAIENAEKEIATAIASHWQGVYGYEYPGFKYGGTISGPESGYIVPTTFHGVEHIVPDQEMRDMRHLMESLIENVQANDSDTVVQVKVYIGEREIEDLTVETIRTRDDAQDYIKRIAAL
jgi:hypothetical protein